MMPILPASVSRTFFIIENFCEPVSQKRPVSSLSSQMIFIWLKSSGACWISSMIIGGLYVWKNNTGSDFAMFRAIRLSSVM
jgi:hypothetical protein